MINFFFRIVLTIVTANFLLLSSAYSEIVNKIEIYGNDRISNETIIMFSSISINDDANKDKINDILKQLYETRFFSDVNIKLENNILQIYLKENPSKANDAMNIFKEVFQLDLQNHE